MNLLGSGRPGKPLDGLLYGRLWAALPAVV
jgi:hypothetical protein